MSEQPQRRRILLWILFILGGVVLICGLSVGGIFYTSVRLTQPASDATREFLVAIQNQDYGRAYNRLSPGLREQFGNEAAFESSLNDRSIFPAEIGTFNSRSVENDIATISGPITMNDGALLTATVELRFDPVADRWVVTGFRFS